MKIEQLKEYPYKTNCFPYRPLVSMKPEEQDVYALESKDNMPSGLQIYRSRGECFLYCIWRAVNYQRCVNLYSIFTHDLVNETEFYLRDMLMSGKLKPMSGNMFNDNGRLRFCSPSNQSLNEYLSHKETCLTICNPDCYVESFDMDQNILEYDMYRDYTLITIQWAPEPYTYLSHREKIDFNELLGTLGGHAHIWLGISIIHIIRYLIRLAKTGEFLPDTSCCCMLFWWKSVYRTKKRYPDY